MITIAIAPLTTTFLVAIRLSTVLLLSPIEAIRLLPIHTRLLLVLILSLLVVGNLSLPALPVDEVSLGMSALAEFCNGLILSLSLYAAFGVFQIAGQLMDAQMGLNSLAIFNQASHANEPLSGRLLSMLAVLYFFAIDGHLKLVQGLVLSFMIITPGQLTLLNGYTPIIQLCSLMFSYAIMIASPVVISLLIIDVTGAILTRNMPQISTYFLTLPIKIILGLFIFGTLLTYINPAMDYVFSSCFQSWLKVIA